MKLGREESGRGRSGREVGQRQGRYSQHSSQLQFLMFIYMDGLLLIDLYDAKGIGQNLLISLL